MKKFICFALVLLFNSPQVIAQVVKIETLAQGLLYPVGIHNTGLPNDDRLFVLEKRGRIKIVNRNTGVVNPVPFLDIYNKVYPITAQFDERGLLGMAFHPDYASNGYFYVNYITPAGKTIISRFQVSAFADTALYNSEQIILNIHQPFSNHNGGNLMFGPQDGYLYIALGDGGSGGDPGNRAQNIDSLLGKTLRIDINNPNPPYYFSAPGNPFYGATPGRDEIFDWGLRNHWRCSFDRLTHDLWSADVGQSVEEEINFRSHCDTIGHNYGWRCYEGNVPYNTSGCQPQINYEAPVYSYPHSLGCSVTGGYVYRGAQEAGLFGKYIFTDYCQGRIWATVPNGLGGWNTNQLIQSTSQINNNFSSFGEDVYGELYLAGIGSGRIYTVKDTACKPMAHILSQDTVYVCGGNFVTLQAIHNPGLTYNWTVQSSTGNWSVVVGQGTATMMLSADLSSNASVALSVSNGSCSALSKTITLLTTSTINGLDSIYCENSPTSTLSGLPAGGVFSGPGVNGLQFNPSLAGPGVHSIQYFIADTVSNCNYAATSCTISTIRTVTVSACTGLNDFTALGTFSLHPNPAQKECMLEFQSTNAQHFKLEVKDACGKILFFAEHSLSGGTQGLNVDLSAYSPGMYFVVLSHDGFQTVKKLIIQ
jgi:glucose/arabinose dehydrogenase